MSEPFDKISRRLRASCDQCHRLKLKCSFNGSESCLRCQKQGVTCVRSSSKPIGRRVTKKKPKADPPLQTTSTSGSGSSTSEKLSPFQASSPSEEEAKVQFIDNINNPLGSPLQDSPLQFGLPTFDTNLEDATLYPIISLDCYTPETQYMPVAQTSEGPRPGKSSHLATNRSCASCTCFVAITCAMRDTNAGSAEKESVCDKLRLNRDSLAIIGDFLACECPHELSLILLVYVLVHKVVAAFAKALYMAGDSVFHFGSYTIDGADADALRHRVIDLDVQKVKEVLRRLALKSQEGYDGTGGWMLNDDETVYRPVCGFMQDLVRKEADNILKQIAEAELYS